MKRKQLGSPLYGETYAEPANVKGTALIGKAARILEVIGTAPGLVTIRELMTETGWPRQTLYRILAAMTAHGFVRYDELQQGYTLGFRLIELAQNVWVSPDLTAIAAVELRRLRDLTGETAYLAVQNGTEVLALAKFESAHPDRSAAVLGIRKPIYCTSQGKSILAHMPPTAATALLDRLELAPLTEHTIIDRGLLASQLRTIRAKGYAVDDEEIQMGTRCVGAAIVGKDGRPVAAISIAGPTYRLSPVRVEQLGPELAAAAANIAAQLRGPALAAAPQAGSPTRLQGSQQCFHGGFPIWDEEGLHWADTLGPILYRYDGAAVTARRLSVSAPILGFCRDHNRCLVLINGELMVVRDDGSLHRLTAASNLSAIVAGAALSWGASQIEDGVTSLGTLDRDGRLSPVWNVRSTVSAIAWCSLTATLYFADSQRGTIYAAPRNGKAPRVLSRIPIGSGAPSGLAVDQLGQVWLTLQDGWSVARLTPEGEFDQVLALPVPRPTGVCFGGSNGATLFVTSARIGLPHDILDKAPLSGELLRIDMGGLG